MPLYSKGAEVVYDGVGLKRRGEAEEEGAPSPPRARYSCTTSTLSVLTLLSRLISLRCCNASGDLKEGGGGGKAATASGLTKTQTGF
jgi:hypothetical protein